MAAPLLVGEPVTTAQDTAIGSITVDLPTGLAVGDYILIQVASVDSVPPDNIPSITGCDVLVNVGSTAFDHRPGGANYSALSDLFMCRVNDVSYTTTATFTFGLSERRSAIAVGIRPDNTDKMLRARLFASHLESASVDWQAPALTGLADIETLIIIGAAGDRGDDTFSAAAPNNYTLVGSVRTAGSSAGADSWSVMASRTISSTSETPESATRGSSTDAYEPYSVAIFEEELRPSTLYEGAGAAWFTAPDSSRMGLWAGGASGVGSAAADNRSGGGAGGYSEDDLPAGFIGTAVGVGGLDGDSGTTARTQGCPSRHASVIVANGGTYDVTGGSPGGAAGTGDIATAGGAGAVGGTAYAGGGAGGPAGNGGDASTTTAGVGGGAGGGFPAGGDGATGTAQAGNSPGGGGSAAATSGAGAGAAGAFQVNWTHDPMQGYGFDRETGRAQFNEPTFFVSSTGSVHIQDGQVEFHDEVGTLVDTLVADHDHDADYEPSGAVATHTSDADAHHDEDHAARHATGDADPVSPASIGAATDDHTHAVDDLSDVEAASPIVGQGLLWNGTAWVQVLPAVIEVDTLPFAPPEGVRLVYNRADGKLYRWAGAYADLPDVANTRITSDYITNIGDEYTLTIRLQFASLTPAAVGYFMNNSASFAVGDTSFLWGQHTTGDLRLTVVNSSGANNDHFSTVTVGSVGATTTSPTWLRAHFVQGGSSRTITFYYSFKNTDNEDEVDDWPVLGAPVTVGALITIISASTAHRLGARITDTSRWPGRIYTASLRQGAVDAAYAYRFHPAADGWVDAEAASTARTDSEGVEWTLNGGAVIEGEFASASGWVES